MKLIEKYGKKVVTTFIVSLCLSLTSLISGIAINASEDNYNNSTGAKTIYTNTTYYGYSGTNEYEFYAYSSNDYKIAFDDIDNVSSISIYNQYGNYCSTSRNYDSNYYYFYLSSGYTYSITIYASSSFSFTLDYYYGY